MPVDGPRECLYAPWRFAYVLSHDPDPDCIFCAAAAAGGERSLTLHRGERTRLPAADPTGLPAGGRAWPRRLPRLGAAVLPQQERVAHAQAHAVAKHDLQGDLSIEALDEALKQTCITQPALFVIEYSLSRLLMSWGLHPQAMIGHSIGEYVAACLSGVFSLEDALKLVAMRGSLMQSVPPGAMISIPLTETEVRPFIKGDLSLAAVNTPSLCVISGPENQIEELIHDLANEGIEFRRLRTSHAFHSVMMEPILEEFAAQVAGVVRNAPSIPFISNVVCLDGFRSR